MNDIVKKEDITKNDTSAIIQIIDRAATDPNVDIDKMERLLNMQERIFDKNAEMAFNTAMSAVQKEMPRIQRESENKQTRSKYAKLEAINRVLVPIYTEYGFALSFGTGDTQTEGWQRITCIASHVSGFSKDFFVDLPIDNEGMQGNANKTKMHGAGSTMSYGRRYLTILIFNISIADEDNDGNISATGLLDKMFSHNTVLRDNLPTILCIKEGISSGDLSSAKEAWNELPEQEQMALWVATTKGGIFTTDERKTIKSQEWSEA